MNIFQIANDSLTSLVLTVGSLLFALFLMVVYFSKNRLNYMRCRLYRLMLVIVSLILFSEVVNIMFDVYNAPEWICKILYVIHWMSILTWFVLFYCHSICYFGDIDAPNFKTFIKENKKVQAIIGFTLLAIIGYFLIPSTDIAEISTTYLSGLAEYYILMVLVLISAWILLEAFVIIKNVPARRKVSTVLIIFVLVVVVLLQLKFPTVCIYSMVTSLHVFFVYFTIENPDIHLKNEIEKLKLDIDRSNRAKTDFLSNMSHEIRTPMNAIVGFSETLLNSPKFDAESARADIQNIAIAGNNLLDIINNILDISKIESEKETLEEKEYDFVNIINELSSIITTRINDSQIKFLVDIEGDIPTKLYGDGTKIYQILLNILNNAAKYTEVGKIKLTVTPEYASNNKDTLVFHFKISDTGYGIKEEDYNKLFEKFSRLDKAISNEIEGTGLGLVITKKFVDLLGGKIWFESEYEVGTTFFVDIPQKVIDSTPIVDLETSRSVEVQTDYVNLSKFNALVVDDNILNIKVLERILKKYNFNVDSVVNGKECVYKVKSGNVYDIIFMDHMMPEMDGIETLHILKKLNGYNIPPVIMVTANAITGMRERFLNEGFDEYLSKPISITDLDKIIHKHLDYMATFSIDKQLIDNPLIDKVEMKIEDIEPMKKNISTEQVSEDTVLLEIENNDNIEKNNDIPDNNNISNKVSNEDILIDTAKTNNVPKKKKKKKKKKKYVEPLVKITDPELREVLEEMDYEDNLKQENVKPMSQVVDEEMLNLLDNTPEELDDNDEGQG